MTNSAQQTELPLSRDGEQAAATTLPHHAPGKPLTTGRRVVVTIGIDCYAAWPHLGNAVNDARGTSELFRGLGFREAHSLINGAATGEAIRKLVTDDLSALGVNDSLVVFFAGHGGTRTQVLRDGTMIKTGYIIPVDAENKQGQVATWIRLDTWLADIARLPPHHILVILDACHSGIALDSLVTPRDVDTWQPDPEDQLSRRRSRRVIVSALDDQVALDGGPRDGHSLFTGYLIEALTGGLPRDGRRAASGTELGLYLQTQVRKYPSSRQTPAFGAFDLNEGGELMIPLFPSLPSTSAQHAVVSPDVNATLRHKLAMLLGEFFPDRIAIAHLVTRHAAMLQTVDLPTGPPVAIWMYVLVELANRGAYPEISAIVDAARQRSRRSRRIDWSVFTALLRTPAVPVVASWSHLTLELRRDSTDAGRSGSALITDGDTLMEAVVLLRWGGVRPSDPLIKVTSYQMFGRTKPLLHEVTLLPSHVPDTASWRVRIPVPRARIRTRKVTVRCVDTDLVERRYVVPRTGSSFAAIVWFAFAAFACYWLAPISDLLLTAPAAAFGVLWGLWSSLGVHLLRDGHNKRSFRSLFFAWELAVLFAALAAILVITIPPRVIVFVTNTTPRDVPLDQHRTIPANAKQQMFWTIGDGWSDDWSPRKLFCRCGHAAECKKCDLPDAIHGVGHVVIGCINGDCDQLTEQVRKGGDATIVRQIDSSSSDGALLPVTFGPDATSPQMSQPKADPAIEVKNVKQAPGADMTLEILPIEGPYSIDFAIDAKPSRGTLEFDRQPSRIVRFPIESPWPHASETIAIKLGEISSKWLGDPGEARACMDRTPDTATITIAPDEVLQCSGGHIERVALLDVTPPATWFRMKFGAVESSWSSETPSKSVRACIGEPGIIELAPLAPGAHVSLPRARGVLKQVVHIRRDGVTAPLVLTCDAGSTVRGVKLVTTNDRPTIQLGEAVVQRFDATTGVTCDAPTRTEQYDHGCALGDAELTCWTVYHGDCQRTTNDRVRPGGSTDDCPLRATPANESRARTLAVQSHLFCQRVYQCQ